MALALAPAAATTATAATAGGGELLVQLIKTLGIQGFAELFAQTAAGAISANASSPYSPVGVQDNSGKYFLGAAPSLNYETSYRNPENRNRAFMRAFGFDLPDVATTAEFMRGIEESQTRQAEGITSRDIKKLQALGIQERMLEQLRADKEFKRIEMEKGADLARAGLERGFSLEEVKQKAIGDIEQEKYSSAYDAAKTLLNSTITAISGQGSYANNPDLRQVATPV